ncbi:hypothetical protein NDU88_005356 [Pleurodeles waltl]|uniref:Uncharacterized protein n=1 Tax=Pleurodeles waltl TaxID=8319 RepID=A0AAV7TU08_PLEWA|nr:hypothetical protein NDU88_005356 [Pleurodeles waltl]
MCFAAPAGALAVPGRRHECGRVQGWGPSRKIPARAPPAEGSRLEWPLGNFRVYLHFYRMKDQSCPAQEGLSSESLMLPHEETVPSGGVSPGSIAGAAESVTRQFIDDPSPTITVRRRGGIALPCVPDCRLL